MKWLLETGAGISLLHGDADDPLAAGVIPGDDVALHRLLPGETAPRRRLEEARMQAVDLAAQPLDDLHVALGPPLADGGSWVAIISADRMDAHLATFAEAGVELTHLLPAPLLLPEQGSARLEGLHLFHTPDLAGAVEPRLAIHLGLTGVVSASDFQLQPDALGNLPLDLLQGAYAPRRRWWKEKGFQRAAGGLLLLALLLWLLPAAITHLRQSSAERQQNRETVELAQAMPGVAASESATDAAAALAAARAQAEGSAISARLGFVIERLQQANAPSLHLTAIRQEGNALRLTLAGPAAAINQLGTSLAAGPFAAEQQGTEMILGPRRPADSENAATRLAAARMDAAIIGQHARHHVADLAADFPARLQQLLEEAGLGSAETMVGPEGARVELPAVRAQALLPLLARLELAGARIDNLSVVAQDDTTLTASFEAHVGATP